MSDKYPFAIGVDIGTGSAKAVAVNTKGEITSSAQVAYPTISPEPQFVEQAPELIWQAFIKCINRIVAAESQPPSAVVLSSAMHSLIPVGAEGMPLMNMITWADNRSASIANDLRASNDGQALYEATGTPIHSMSPMGKIIWLKQHRPALFAETAHFLSIKEYIWYRLFGAYEVDYSIASATGLFNLVSCQWHKRAINLCGIGAEQLSIPVPVDHMRKDVATDVANKLSLPADTPFLIGSSDGCLANIGSFAMDEGVAALTIGTSGAIRVASRVPKLNFSAMTFCYRVFDDLFICGGPINNGGVVLKWYASNMLGTKLTSDSDYEQLIQPITDIPTGSGGVIFLPYLLGERAPYWNSDSSAVFFGLRHHHSQHHMTRAVIEGISMALLNISKAMEQGGLSIERIHVSGGFVHAESWLQILANMFNKEIHLIHEDDASALGAAYLGLTTLKLVDGFDTFNPVNRKVYHPDAESHRVYKRIFPHYENLYQLLHEEMRQLSNMNED